jgi:hypothetical protein
VDDGFTSGIGVSQIRLGGTGKRDRAESQQAL